jgi:predicted nuclease of restriction endonuclease-like (RecB) superfamily
VSDKQESSLVPAADALFARVAAILDEARGNVVRSVNSNMVLAYWLIGREIVVGVQEGEAKAEYGSQVLMRLSERLQSQFGKGFSVPNLENFRRFYLAYRDRGPISYLVGTKLAFAPELAPIRNPTGSKSHDPAAEKSYPLGRKSAGEPQPAPRLGFAQELTWSHYRALMRVTNEKARDFYEQEAIECGWSKAQLERQIHSSLYQRILANQGEEGLVAATRERLPGEPISAKEILRSPLVLEFLDLPDSPVIHESTIEQAIIDNLQAFLLELGKGFSFVARQRHIRFDDEDFYIDLVFYNFILKCFLLIDLKIGKLTHGDVGQMDGYVRLFENRFKVEGDNPTIGLILCSEKGEAVAKYSVLNEGKQIFASRYLAFLPTEDELARELEKERRQIEARTEQIDG